MAMPSNIVGYEWALEGTAQVVYETGDNHIHEMVSGRDRRWKDDDVTRVAGGPELESAIIVGYAWPDGHTKQIAYTSPMDASGHIHELVIRQGNTWSYADLMKQTIVVPPSDGNALAGFAWKAGRTKQVVYTSGDGHIHELAGGVVSQWYHTDITQLTGAPIAEGSLLAGYPFEKKRTKQVVYTSGDGHIHELMMEVGGPWHHIDLMEITNAPPADGSALVGYAWENRGTKQVVYTGNDGNIYELEGRMDGRWRYADLMQFTNAPLPGGSALAAYAWETGNTNQVVFVGRDRHVHELTMDANGSWSHIDLTHLLRAPDAGNDVIVGYEWSAQFAKHVVYLDKKENPHIQSLMFRSGSSWQHEDLTELTGAPEIV